MPSETEGNQKRRKRRLTHGRRLSPAFLVPRQPRPARDHRACPRQSRHRPVQTVRPTLGPLGNGDAKARCDHLVEFGEKPAKVQMSGYFLSDEGTSFPRRKEIRKGVNGGCPMEGGCHQPPGSRSRDRVARLDVVGGTVGGSRERDAGDREGEGAAVFGPRRGEGGRPPSSRGLR
jgi:hypothetical protein